MKKTLSVILAALMLVCLVSCGEKSEKVKNDQLLLMFMNKTGESIKGISIDYSAGGQNGSFFVGLSGGIIADGESFTHTISADELKTQEKAVDFFADCSVLSEKDVKCPCINSMSFTALFGEKYTYVIDGNAAMGFHLTKVSSIDG